MVAPATGRRIVNEWSDRKTRSNAMLKTGGPCLGIVDSKGAESDPESLAICLKRGKIKKFDSIAKLARSLLRISRSSGKNGGPATTKRCGKKPSMNSEKISPYSAGPLENPPFYGMRLHPKVHYTPGGLGIDEKARVPRYQGEAHPRTVRRRRSLRRNPRRRPALGGCALVECIVFGRIAGREAGGGEE